MTRPCLVLWCATLLFYLGFQLLLPITPLYATALGAREAEVGLIMGSFALAAMVLRPLAGDLADRIGRRPLVLLGTAIFMLAPVGYALVGTVPALLVVRLFQPSRSPSGRTPAGSWSIALASYRPSSRPSRSRPLPSGSRGRCRRRARPPLSRALRPRRPTW